MDSNIAKLIIDWYGNEYPWRNPGDTTVIWFQIEDSSIKEYTLGKLKEYRDEDISTES